MEKKHNTIRSPRNEFYDSVNIIMGAREWTVIPHMMLGSGRIEKYRTAKTDNVSVFFERRTDYYNRKGVKDRRHSIEFFIYDGLDSENGRFDLLTHFTFDVNTNSLSVRQKRGHGQVQPIEEYPLYMVHQFEEAAQWQILADLAASRLPQAPSDNIPDDQRFNFSA